MRYAFLIPFRTDNGHREKLFNWNVERINRLFPDSNVYVGGGPDGEFNRSAAINEAFSKIQDESFIIINDSDTVWNSTLIMNGIYALTHNRFVIPYSHYHLMDAPHTGKILSEREDIQITHTNYDYENTIQANPHVWHAPPVSGVLMMRASDFIITKGFDQRFRGWGEEDVAFVIRASERIGRPVRLKGDVYHLWHPRGEDYNQPHYKDNQRLLRKEYL